MTSGPSQREVAIAQLPDDVTRGWEWVPILLISGFMATGGVLHLTGFWTLTLGRRSTTPMPNWLAAGIGGVGWRGMRRI